ncbi:hypothetical protein BJV82DRAFT_508834 [Fennellomyces sp. T-0311]|nr:hypothetical protein BJV82DRAFT_508834 [Fennellomyces sp. T-0311]
MTTENIVIIGGGYAGLGTARELEKRFSGNSKYRIIMIDKKSFFYHIVGGPRAAVEHINNIVPYTKVFSEKKNIVAQATVVRFEKNKIYLEKPFEGSTELPFAYAVLATGIHFPTPCKVAALEPEDAKLEQQVIQKQVKEANSILIVGGGPTGIELAGEIREKYKDKKVTLVHDQKQLMYDVVPDKFRAQILRKMEKNNIKVILDDLVQLPSLEKTVFKPEAPLTTRKNVSLSADLVMLMFGTRPETDWLKDSVPLEKGFIKIKPTLQVDAPGFEHVYAAGDAADIKELKVAAKTKEHAAVVAANIENASKSKPLTQEYKPSTKFIMALTFGKKQGFLFTPMGNLGDWLATKLKSKDMMTARFWKELGLTEPAK